MEIYPVPPEYFCAQLRAFDPQLQLNWDPVHKVWAIWHRDPYTNELSHVMNVINNDGSYRPLDGRVFKILQSNRYYAEHPKELEALMCDRVYEERERSEKYVHQELSHLAKDRALNRKFKEIVDRARSVPWDHWKKPVPLHDKQGNLIMVPDGNGGAKPLQFMPHSSIVNSPKPSDNEII